MTIKTLVIMAAISLGLSVTGCDKSKDKSKRAADTKPGETSAGKAGKRAGGGKTVAVRAMIAEAKVIPKTIDMVTVLSGRKQAEVYSRVAGKISYIGPAEGSRVKEGDTLFRVDRSDPGESFLATPVVSPISGWVGRWIVNSVGVQVIAQQPVVTIVDDEVLHAQIQLPTNEWLLVTAETPIRVTVGAQSRPAKVVGITRSAEAASSRGTISIDIDNKDHGWKAGMVAAVAFDLDSRERLILPASALAITDQGAFVFEVKEGKAFRTAIKFSVVDNDQVEVLSGISAGAQIVTEGTHQVGDGIALHVVDREAAK